ncbi:MAG: ATP-binding cassette domain-containing protein, partial [Ruthenibacterium sp.]
MALLEVKNIYKSFGGVKAIQDFSLEANAGEIHGIIGPNGAGKTTIFNVISGVYPAEQGSVMLDGRDITKIEQFKITRLGMGRTFQNIRLFKGLTVEENVMCAFDPQSKYSILGGLLPTPMRSREEKRGR